MRIPQGSDFFGQRIAQVIPRDDAESLRAMELSKGKIDTGVYLAAKETEKIGNTLMNIGINEKLHEEKIKLIEEHKQQQKLEQAKKKKEKSDAEVFATNYASAADSIYTNVLNNPDIKDADKLKEVENYFGGLRDAFASTLTDEEKHIVGPLHAKVVAAATHNFNTYQTEKYNKDAQANVLTIHEQLIKEAAKSPEARQIALQKWDMVDKSMFDAVNVVKMRESLAEKTADNEIKASVLEKVDKVQLTNPKAAMANSKQIMSLLEEKDNDGNYKNWQELDPDRRTALMDALANKQGQITNDIKQQQHEAVRIKNSIAETTFKAWKDLAEVGFFNTAQTATVGQVVKGTPWENNYRELFKKVSSDLWRQEQARKQGIIFYANELGIPMAPLNIAQPMDKQLQYRKEVIDYIYQKKGIRESIFSPDETNSTVELFKDAGPKNSTVLFQTLIKNAGAENAKLIVESWMKKDPVVAFQLGFHIDGKKDIAEKIAEGRKYINDKVVKLPDEGVFQKEFTRLIKDSFLELPETNKAHYEIFKSYYVSTSARKGIANGIYDTNTGGEAFKAVVGTVVKRNGKYIALPEGYDESKYKNFMKSISGDSIAASGGVSGLSNDDASSLIKDDAQLYATNNPSVFRIVVDGKYLVRADKKGYFTLTFQPDWTPSGVSIEGKGSLENILWGKIE